MSKAFFKESESDEEPEHAAAPALPPSGKNYITPGGYARLEAELRRLVEIVRSAGRDTDQVFFGATVRVKSTSGEKTVTIVGVDEVDPAHGRVSWVSPIAKALLKAREGDTVTLRTPAGEEKLEI